MLDAGERGLVYMESGEPEDATNRFPGNLYVYARLREPAHIVSAGAH